MFLDSLRSDTLRDMNDQKRASAFSLDSVDGFDAAARRVSYTTSSGVPRIQPIEGVALRLVRPASHPHGHLTEVFREDWGVTDAPLVQVTFTTTFPGRVRAWGLHEFTTDRLFAATGSLCIVCYDGRQGSPTYGASNEFFLGEYNQGLVIIPPGVYHGWKNIGANEASIVSMPSRMYDHESPDRYELRWDSPEAEQIIPYVWE